MGCCKTKDAVRNIFNLKIIYNLQSLNSNSSLHLQKNIILIKLLLAILGEIQKILLEL